MAQGAVLGRKEATPTLEQFRAVKHNCITVGASVLELTRSDRSKGIIIQNKHASQTLYVGGGIPQLIMGRPGNFFCDMFTGHTWRLSGSGTNEYYYATDTNGDPGLTEVTYMFYKTHAGSETLATNGTVGSLAAQHNWDWGDNDTLGFSTIYVRTGGNNPGADYEHMLGYTFTLSADDTATTGGIEISSGSVLSLTLDGSGKIFAIASGAGTPAGIIEVF